MRARHLRPASSAALLLTSLLRRRRRRPGRRREAVGGDGRGRARGRAVLGRPGSGAVRRGHRRGCPGVVRRGRRRAWASAGRRWWSSSVTESDGRHRRGHPRLDVGRSDDQEWAYRTVADLVRGRGRVAGDLVGRHRRADPRRRARSSTSRRSTPDRGDILGAGGLALVTERPVSRVGIDKPTVAGTAAGASARALAKLVGIDPEDYAKQVEAAGPQAFVEAIVYRQEDVTPGDRPGGPGHRRRAADRRVPAARADPRLRGCRCSAGSAR